MLTPETMIRFLRTDRPPLGVDCDQCYSARASLLTAPYIPVRITATSLSKLFIGEPCVLCAERFSGQPTQLDECPSASSVLFGIIQYTSIAFGILRIIPTFFSSFETRRHLSLLFGICRHPSVPFGSIRHSSLIFRHPSVPFGSIRLSQINFGILRHSSVSFGSIRHPSG